MVHYNNRKVDVMKRRNKSVKIKTRWSHCVEKFKEFCKRTDLHGFKYIVMDNLSIIERSVWAGAVVISIIFAAFFVMTAYRWYARNPIVTVIESTQGAIWDVPFPAVTVCDLNIVSRRAARAFSNNLTLPENVTSDDVFKLLKLTPLIHSLSFARPEQKKDLQKLQDVLDLNGINLETMFRNLSPATSCDNLVERCMWKTTIYRCDQLFQHVAVVVSLCCSFNYYAVGEINSFNNPIIRLPTPRRVASCGYQTALTALIRTDPTDYYSTDISSHGVMVFIDTAYNWPDYDSPVRLINPSSEVLIALSPERTYATPGIRAFSPEQRQCYYNDEIKVGSFHQYSFHNCMAFRRAELLKTFCDCIPFYFPQKGYHRTCNFRDMECMEKVLNPESDVEETSEDYIPSMTCLPECEHYDYPMEVALGRLAVELPLSGLPFYENVKLENRSVLNVFFNDLVSTRYRRDVYLNWQNILASFGGLLSLMMGFTLISGFDFILFFVMRVVYDSITKWFPKGDVHPSTKPYIIDVQNNKRRRLNDVQNIKYYLEDLERLRNDKSKKQKINS